MIERISFEAVKNLFMEHGFTRHNFNNNVLNTFGLQTDSYSGYYFETYCDETVNKGSEYAGVLYRYFFNKEKNMSEKEMICFVNNEEWFRNHGIEAPHVDYKPNITKQFVVDLEEIKNKKKENNNE